MFEMEIVESYTQRIVLTRGIQGSGKTTWATAQAGNANFVRVSRDDLRAQLFNRYSGVDEDLITAVETATVKAALKAGNNVVVDAMHLYQRDINRWQRLGYPVEVVEFTKPLDKLLVRNSLRTKRVPEVVIANNFKKVTTDRYGSLKPVTLNPELYMT